MTNNEKQSQINKRKTYKYHGKRFILDFATGKELEQFKELINQRYQVLKAELVDELHKTHKKQGSELCKK